MPILFTETRRLPNLRTARVLGTLTFSGSYVTSGEVPTGILFKAGSTKPPISVKFDNRGTYHYKYDTSTGKVLLYLGGVELAAGAYPAAVTSDVVTMDIEYNKLV